MYAMSWERDTKEYKYESIQHGYEIVDEYEETEGDEDLSLDELMENGFDLEEEME